MSSTLDQLPPGRRAVICGFAPLCPHRQRLMELGFLPGAAVAALYPSPWGDPVAYAVAGSVVALRQSEARCILLSGKDEPFV